LNSQYRLHLQNWQCETARIGDRVLTDKDTLNHQLCNKYHASVVLLAVYTLIVMVSKFRSIAMLY